MLIKRKNAQSRPSGLQASRLGGSDAGHGTSTMDRRAFLARSGLAAGTLAGVTSLGFGTVAKAKEAPANSVAAGGAVTLKKNMCTHCSVGCTIIGEVQNGVWIGQ